MRKLVAFVAGLVFGLGLLISDMANPARVLAFLDLLAIREGTWDPRLMVVMAGAMTRVRGARRCSGARCQGPPGPESTRGC